MWTYTDVLVDLNMKYMYEVIGMSYIVCIGERCTLSALTGVHESSFTNNIRVGAHAGSTQ